MTERLFETDSHLKLFYAKVLLCEKIEKNDKDKKGYKIVLDKTAFFPEGGGQTADTGYIDGVRVLDVQTENGVIYHYLEQDIPEGKEVECKLDWGKRFDKMQNHSGEHIISGIVHSLFGYDNVGFHLSDTEMTMDFGGMLSFEDLRRVEKLANEVIYRNAKFNCYYPESLEGLEYRSKLDLCEDVRIVEIEGIDMPIAPKQEIYEGAAVILSTLNGSKAEEYDISALHHIGASCQIGGEGRHVLPPCLSTQEGASDAASETSAGEIL